MKEPIVVDGFPVPPNCPAFKMGHVLQRMCYVAKEKDELPLDSFMAKLEWLFVIQCAGYRGWKDEEDRLNKESDDIWCSIDDPDLLHSTSQLKKMDEIDEEAASARVCAERCRTWNSGS